MTRALEHGHRYTVDEYLRIERNSTEKHEFRDGEIITMAGGSAEHSLITVNTLGELRQRLRGKPCRVYDSNLRLRIARTLRYSYPDGIVICGETKFDPQDTSRTTATNPTLVIEVLSPSTEMFDRGEKFRRYLQLESLEEYVLIAQDEARIETYSRQAGGTWLFTTFVGRQSVAKLRCLQIELPLAEVYAGVEFPEAADPAAQ